MHYKERETKAVPEASGLSELTLLRKLNMPGRGPWSPGSLGRTATSLGLLYHIASARQAGHTHSKTLLKK